MQERNTPPQQLAFASAEARSPPKKTVKSSNAPPFSLENGYENGMEASTSSLPSTAEPSPSLSRSLSLGQPRGRPASAGVKPMAGAVSLEVLEDALNDARGPSDVDLTGRRGMLLQLEDGSAYEGISFGCEGKSISGELVFQTGMVGYPESLTDPSYSGQILVLTYPLIGSYGVPARDSPLNGAALPAYFESPKIHVAGLVISSYSGDEQDYSHHLASSGLGKWLQEQGVPAIYGVDTRSLTKRIREQGVLLAKVLAKQPASAASAIARSKSSTWRSQYVDVPLHDPNLENLVAAVSCRKPVLFTPATFTGLPAPPQTRMHPSGRALRVIAIDVGMKYNQIRCFVLRGVELKVVPWDYDFLAPTEEPYDGLFISNGPGDPTMVPETVLRIRKAMELARVPIFGICLGHQLLSLAAGAQTIKLKYGNRGANLPCTSMISGRCYITSQNHGYAVDASTLPEGWKELFVNANDGSNEGVYSTKLPYFSVQFHPESTPGPRDTEFLFDVFINNIVSCAEAGKLMPIVMPGGSLADNAAKYPRVTVRKVLVLGSGGLSIGQAGEFDYSGSQAIKALKEEGIYTVLINPNIATIQTSKGLADKVYFLPVTPDFVRKVIKHERPDGIYVTFGGQTALNVGIKLKDEFAGLGVRVLGTPIETIITTEDRELFAQSMLQIGERCAKSASATNIEEALTAAKNIGFPVIVRAAFALGGLGSGFANDEKELVELCTKAFAASPQVLVERSMKGWKEIEYEVVRDCRDNCITVCNMENFDPLGIHTGDSIVVAPSQTLSDADFNMLRTTAVNVIRHLGVVGECNIQYALNPDSQEYCIIEVNARLSRSSALASKATGYPLAFIAAKLGLGIPLNEIRNSVTKLTSACFEPSLDYCVVKIPRWDLKKFNRVSVNLGSSMKSVGEVMSIGRTFEEAIQKAIRSIDPSFAGFGKNSLTTDDEIDHELRIPSDRRIFAIANAMHKGYSVDKIWEMSRIDKWFLRKLHHLSQLEGIVSRYTPITVPAPLLLTAKQMGFSDRQIAKQLGSNELAVRRLRQEAGIMPLVKQIDTVAAEFPAYTNYLYMTYNAIDNDISFEDQGVMVLGSGVYRIGSSVEFDWCAVRAIRTLRDRGFKTIMVNYNPETVSTDYDEADRLYFETISLETILDIYEIERSAGVIISMGGQTPNNIALPLHRQNVKILGTSPEMIDTAENRYKFSRMLDKIDVDQPLWKELTDMDEAYAFCKKVDYPVLVRPSYVLSGAAMNVVYSQDDLAAYLTQAANVSREHPVVISKYIEEAKEIEMDAVAKNGKLVMHYISEHVENAGVHSGDATLVLPPQDLDPETVKRIIVATTKIGNALNVTGPFNIQFIAKNNEIKVIECNLRAARSWPFVSKVTGIDAIELATDVMIGVPVVPYPPSPMPADYVGVKVPQFSFSRLSGADPILGVEMASTGEVACFGKDRYEAYLKALLASGMSVPKKNVLLSIGSYKEKLEMLPSVQKLHRLGFHIFATAGTADFIQEHGIPVKYLEELAGEDANDPQKAEYSLTQHLANNLIDLYINLPSKNKFRRPASYMSRGYRSRRLAVDFAVPLITNVKCAKLFIEAIVRKPTFQVSSVDAQTSHETLALPGLIALQAFAPGLTTSSSADVAEATAAALRGGFTTVQFLPAAVEVPVIDTATLDLARHNAALAHCAYSLCVAATQTNANALRTESVAEGVGALVLPSNVGVSAVAAHFAAWPADKPIVTDAKRTDLASILLLASLHNRSVHVTNVTNGEDIQIIALSKEKGLRVTCDVSIYALTLKKEDYPLSSCLPSAADRRLLWANMAAIDAFSIGTIPYELAKEQKLPYSPKAGFEEALPLLLPALADGRLTIDDLIARLSDNPRTIFGLPATEAQVEIELNPRAVLTQQPHWSPLDLKPVAGSVHRVTLGAKTVFLDGESFSDATGGLDVSIEPVPLPRQRRKTTRFSFSASGRPSLASLPAAATTSTSSMDAVVQSPSAANFVDGRSPPQPPAPMLAYSSPAFRGVEKGLEPSLMQLSATAPSALVSLPAFARRHVLSIKQYTRNDLHALFNLANELRIQVERNTPIEILRGKVLCTLFYETSTRTSASFETAMNRLGGKVVAVSAATASVQKGETLVDTIHMLSGYGDAIVLRHPTVGSVQTAAKVSKVPIINGGDGIGEHPTQAMLDVYTIREELGTVNGLTVTMVGDLKNGRTVHSLARLLAIYEHITLNFVAPPSLGMPESVKAELRRLGVAQNESTKLDDFIAQTDVLYVTRVQQERFASATEYEAVKDAYIIDNDVLSRAKANMRVMHPLPRNNEIAPEVDYDPRAAYFRAARAGVYVRMALLALCLSSA